MLEENAIWLIYLYGLYEDLGKLITISLIVSGIGLLIIGGLLAGIGFLDGDKDAQKIFHKYIPKSISIWFLVIIFMTFIPSRNIAIMMISAKPIIGIAKDIKDSNTTKSLINILDNSVIYLEKKSKELNK